MEIGFVGMNSVPMANMIGHKGEETSKKMGFTALLVSMGHQASGALELFNYPLWLRDLIAHDMDNKDRPDHIDLAALEGVDPITALPFSSHLILTLCFVKQYNLLFPFCSL